MKVLIFLKGPLLLNRKSPDFWKSPFFGKVLFFEKAKVLIFWTNSRKRQAKKCKKKNDCEKAFDNASDPEINSQDVLSNWNNGLMESRFQLNLTEDEDA